jgi:hypothetical protein
MLKVEGRPDEDLICELHRYLEIFQISVWGFGVWGLVTPWVPGNIPSFGFGVWGLVTPWVPGNIPSFGFGVWGLVTPWVAGNIPNLGFGDGDR